MSGLLILGAGGHAKVVAETAIASCAVSSAAFLDDRCTGPDACPPVLGWPVIGPLAMALQQETVAQVNAAVVASVMSPRLSTVSSSFMTAAITCRC